MRVLLTGATGFLGGRVCTALLHSGHTVRVTVRANSDVSELPPQVEIANADIQDAPALLEACEGCDAVIHTAALVGSWLPDNSKFITGSILHVFSSESGAAVRLNGTCAFVDIGWIYVQVNVQGLKNVIAAVKANPSVKKLVYTSSFFALGYTDGHIVVEDQVSDFPSP